MAKIVVGVDGSPGAQAALRFALEEARLRGATVTAVFVWRIPFMVDAPTSLLPELSADFRREAEEAVEQAVAEIGDLGGVEVERVVAEGSPAHALVQAAADADLLVVGSRGLGGFRGLLLGSVSAQCAHHATCPLVIVPTPRSE